MVIGVCGLGLIGGSMAKAYKADGHIVYGFDKDTATVGYALLDSIIDGELNSKTIN